MTEDKRVDNDLQQFLEWNAAQTREGYTIANLMLRQDAFFHEVRRNIKGHDHQIHHLNGRVADVENGGKDLQRIVDEHTVAIRAIKRRIRAGSQDDEMDTGVHQLEALQERLAVQEQKRRDSERVKADEQVWWKRTIIMWVAGILGVVATSLLTVLVTMAITNAPARAPAPAPSPATAPR